MTSLEEKMSPAGERSRKPLKVLRSDVGTLDRTKMDDAVCGVECFVIKFFITRSH